MGILWVFVLRLSPILTFSWANYLFGLSPAPFTAFSLGTFLGCLPAVTAYVNAGRLGAEIVVNGVSPPPTVIVKAGQTVRFNTDADTLAVVFTIHAHGILQFRASPPGRPDNPLATPDHHRRHGRAHRPRPTRR